MSEGARSRAAMAMPATILSAERSPVPLYHRLYVILRDQIVSGHHGKGSLLPSELELSALFGVSRITAKRALDELNAEGLVERARGRGTRVIDRPAEVPGGRPISASIDGLRENLSVIGRETSVRVVEFGYLPAPALVAERLQLAANTAVQRAVRVRGLDGQPLSQSTTFIPEEIGRTFARDDLATTPLIELIEAAGIKVASAEQSITATLADSITAGRLDVQVGSALLLLKRLVVGRGGHPVQYIEILYRPDRFEYRMALTRDQAARHGRFAAP
ncbi:MAG TPA: GntR family transcriptional regulator [Hyphomicrobiales bacterium]|nr:GntR family transcriptional regulator [Hyphomicrobiales bacterium]